MPQEYRDNEQPPGSDGDIDIGTLAPGAAPAAGPEPGRKKRGRPPGSGNGSPRSAAPGKNQKVALDLSSITGLFVGLHVVIAEASKTPEIAINMQEGDHIMRAAQNVMRHYNVQSTQKTLDWISLVGACSMVYVPRIVTIAANKRAREAVNINPRPQPTQAHADAPPGSPAEELFSMANVAHPEDGF